MDDLRHGDKILGAFARCRDTEIRKIGFDEVVIVEGEMPVGNRQIHRLTDETTAHMETGGGLCQLREVLEVLLTGRTANARKIAGIWRALHWTEHDRVSPHGEIAARIATAHLEGRGCAGEQLHQQVAIDAHTAAGYIGARLLPVSQCDLIAELDPDFLQDRH